MLGDRGKAWRGKMSQGGLRGMLLLVVTAVFVGVVACLLPQLLATRATPRERPGSLPTGNLPPQVESDCSLERQLALEQRFCRCDGCGHVFLLSFERRIAEALGDTTVNEVWIKCARPSCQRRQPVLVPMSSWNHMTSEWLGADEPASARRSRRALQEAFAREGKTGEQPGTELTKRPGRG